MNEEYSLKLSGKEWEDLQEQGFKEASKNAKVDGFRKGNAPKSVYVKQYGTKDILFAAADIAIKKEYNRLLTEEKVMPVIEPKVDLVKCDEKELEVKFVFTVEPKVELGQYKNLKIKAEKVKVTKEEIKNRIDSLLNQYADLTVKEGKVESGDTAIIDFEGFKDGVAFEGGKGENYSLVIGSNTFIPGFEDAVIGMEKGSEKDIELTFPEDYMAEELKGQKVTFKVKVNEIKTRVVPELNNDFFEDLNMEGVDSKETLESAMEEEIHHQKEHEAEHAYEDKCLDAAINNMKIELSSDLINDEVEHMYQEFIERMQMQGINEDLYFKYTGTNKEDVKKQMQEEATKRLKARYLLKNIIAAEKIEVSEKEIKDKIKEIATMYNVPEEEVTKSLTNDNVTVEIQYEKALDIVKSNEKE